MIWKPHARQEAFLSIPDTVKEALYGGAAGGGKSEALLLLPLARGFYQHPRFKGIIFRRTFPELEAEIIQRAHAWYPHTGAKYNQEKRRWVFPNGGIMQFGHMEYENDARKYDSAEYNYIAFDELTSFTEWQYTYLMSRSRSSSPDLPAIIRGATNPGNIGHAWVRKRFIEPAPYGTIIIDKVTGLKRIFIQATVTDNPHIDQNYVNVLGMLPESEKRAKRDGDWWTFEGQVFEDFRSERFEGEPDEAIHVIDPFDIPDWWPRILAVDWGFSALTYGLWGAISPERRLYVYREYATRQALRSEWATQIGKISRNEKLNDVILCQSAWQQRGEDATTADDFKKYSGLTPRSSENDKGSRIQGKLLVQEYLRWKQMPKRKVPDEGYNAETAQRILRMHGMEAYEEYLESFREQAPETNLPKLQIFRSCPELIKTIPLCVYDDKDRATGKPAEDVKEFNGDDPYDTLRYLVKGAHQMTRDNKSYGEYHDKVQSVLKDFERNHDYTALHRRMEVIERQKPKVTPIRRFSRRAS